MNYELVKELKEAGFPLKQTNWNADSIPLAFQINDDWYLPPTLSELIAACGERLWTITRHSHGQTTPWMAGQYLNGGWLHPHGYGDTPEEAVARLWLALNKK